MATKKRRRFSRNLALFVRSWPSTARDSVSRHPSAALYPSDGIYPTDKDSQ